MPRSGCSVSLAWSESQLKKKPGPNKSFGDFFFFNWDSPQARVNSHDEAWSYKKRRTKRITGYRKSV